MKGTRETAFPLIDAVLRYWVSAESRLAPERGATLVEYALLVALIAVIAIAAMQNLGGSLSDQYGNIADCIDDPAAPCQLPGP